MGEQVSNPFTGDGDVYIWVKYYRVGQKPQTNKQNKNKCDNRDEQFILYLN